MITLQSGATAIPDERVSYRAVAISGKSKSSLSHIEPICVDNPIEGNDVPSGKQGMERFRQHEHIAICSSSVPNLIVKCIDKLRQVGTA